MVHAFVDDSWEDFAGIAGTEDLAPPYVYVVDSVFARPYSITLDAKEFIVVDMRMFSHLSMLSSAIVNEFSLEFLTFAFGRIYAEKLYLAYRFKESATHFLVSDSALPQKFNRSPWLWEATAWQLRFMLAHELCHTMIRLSRNFREYSLQKTRDLLGRITMSEWRRGKPEESVTPDWFDKNIPVLSANLGVSEDNFSSFRRGVASTDETPFHDDQLASLREDDSWLEEVTCDLQAALHIMRKAKDAQELANFTAYIAMALSNLHTMGHAEVVARNYSDPSRRHVREPKGRLFVVEFLLASENWRDFIASSPDNTPWPEKVIFRGPWESPERRLRISKQRARAIVNLNKAWEANVSAPVLMAYPAAAEHLSVLIREQLGHKIEELADNPAELRRAIDSMFRPDDAASGSATSFQQDDYSEHDGQPASAAFYPLSVPPTEEEADDVEDAFRHIVDSADPDAPLTVLGRAALLAEQGDDDGAEDAFRRAADSTDVDAAALAEMALGVRLETRGDTEGAMAAYRRVIETGHPDAAPMAAVSLGVQLHWRGDTKGAEAAYRLAADSGHPSQAPMGWMGLGALLDARDDRTGAEEAYRRAMDSGDANQGPMAAFNLGILLLEQGDDEGAGAAFKHAVDSGHADAAPMALVELGALLLERGDNEGAETAFRRAVNSEDPSQAPVAALYLGVLLQQRGDDNHAEAAFRRAVNSGHADAAPMALMRLGVLLHLRGDDNGAESTYRRAIDSGHAYGAAMAAANLGLLLHQRKDAQGAEAAYRLAADSGRTDDAAMLAAVGLGILLQAQGEAARAASALRTASDCDDASEVPVLAFSLGVSLQERGDAKGAEIAYRLAADSGHADAAPEAALRLGDLLQERGDDHAAEAAYRRAGDSGHTQAAPAAEAKLSLLLQKRRGADDGETRP
jgi:tetratricopeptide (TPR) repeat protein